MHDLDVKDQRIQRVCDKHAAPLVFATISGAHLYGFASPDSDVDLRGVHLLPAQEMLSLREPRETMEQMLAPGDPGSEGLDLDLVTHDLKKFMRLLLRPNGYVLEQLCSPWVVRTSDCHQAMLNLIPQLVTFRHAHHYLGFAATQEKLWLKETPHRVKPLLYLYRVLLTGIHLMHSGEICAHLPSLLHLVDTDLQQAIEGLIQLKVEGCEKQTLAQSDDAWHTKQVAALNACLEQARDNSHLPEKPSQAVCQALDELLIATRMGG